MLNFYSHSGFKKTTATAVVFIVALLGNQHSASFADTLQQAPETVASPLKLNHPSAFLDSVPPEYPDMARRAEIEGTVVLHAIISETGELLDARIASGVNPLLDRAALNALQGSSFSPAVRDGNNIQSELMVSYPFDLELFYREHVSKERPPIDWTPPLISEIGEFVETRGSGKNEWCVYSHNGIKIFGDITLALFNQVIEQVQPLLEEDEEVFYIRHLLAFKELGKMGYRGVSDLEVFTCSSKNSVGNCESGSIFTYVNKDGEYTLKYQDGTTTTWH